MRIDSSGNIGIGTTSPTAPLHITQESNAISGTNVDVSNLGLKIINPQNDNNEAVGMGFALSTASSNIGAAIIHQRDDVQSRGSLSFATKPALGEGADIPIRMTISSDGNVGIGTDSPSAALEVNSGGGIHLTDNTAGRTLIIKPSLTGSIHEFTSDNTAAGYAFSNSSSELMRVNSTGLGIGNTAPAKNLHITDSSSPTIRFSRDNSFYWDIGHTSSDFQFISESGGTVLHMNYDGNIGIGTDSPQGNLHVEGAAGVSGGGIIYVTDADNGSTASDALQISKSGDTAFIYNRETSGNLQLGAGGNANHMIVSTDGKVGIGTNQS